MLLAEPGHRSVALADRRLYEGFGVIVRDGVAGCAGTPLLAGALADPYGCSGASISRLLRGATPEHALAWWDAYVRLVVPPVLHAYLRYGVVLEPHLQNVLVAVDGDGHPVQAIFRFLELLGPVKGERILDIGTGTGWTAALLSDRVGSENVTSVEIDPQVAAQAAENIHAAGYTPTLIVGDGAAGWPQGAPYDGIHVTCGVSEIPYEWVRQLRPGGRTVLPWMSGTGGFKLRLKATKDGRGVGTFHGGAGYMMLRSQRPISGWAKHHQDDAQVTTTRLDPAQVMDADPGADLTLIMNVPRLIMLRYLNDDGTKSCFVAEIDDPKGSWATYDSSPTGLHTVTQYGDRRLWDEVEAAFTQWTQLGSPGPDRFRLTVQPDGQRLWLDNPTC